MSRDGSGNYTLPAGNPPTTNTPITVSWSTSTMSDIAAELTDSLNRSGKGAMLAALKIIDGSSATPGLAFSNEANSGLYRSGNGVVKFSLGGADLLTFHHTATASAVAQNTNITNGDVSFLMYASGVTKFQMAYVGTAGRIVNDAAAGDGVLRTQGGAIRLSVDSGSTSSYSLTSSLHTWTTTTGSGRFEFKGSNPWIRMNNTSATTDNKYWGMETNAGTFTFRAYADDLTANAIAFSVTRSGAAIGTISLQTATGTLALTGTTTSLSNGTVTSVWGFTGSPGTAWGTSSNHEATIQTNGVTRMTFRADGPFKGQTFTVATLPTAATAGAGARSFVTDSTVAGSGNFGATVVGGGSNNVPVYSDGTNWKIG